MIHLQLRHKTVLYPALMLAFVLALGGGPASAQDQNAGMPSEELLSAQDMLGQNAPENQEQEQAPAQQEEQQQTETQQEEQTEQTAQTNENEALPNVTELKIRAQGFPLIGESNITVYPGDNPADSVNQEAMIEDIRREAFDAAVTGLFPLKPNHIKSLLRYYDETEEAAQGPIYDLPSPEVSVLTVSMDPGVQPPTIKTAIGHVTTLNVLDITGAPWPIQDITWAGDFELTEPEEGGHIIRITPMAKFTYGNLSIRLLTLKTPITFAVRVGRESVHYRVDARVPEFGPFAEAQLMEGGTQLVAGSTTLTAVLDGAPPSGAQALNVSGVDGRTTAYRMGAMTYVRTPLTLLSPGWESSVSSADGMNVYALNQTPILLLSDQGQFKRATLTEKKDIFDE